jgi:hypothetical protein
MDEWHSTKIATDLQWEFPGTCRRDKQLRAVSEVLAEAGTLPVLLGA